MLIELSSPSLPTRWPSEPTSGTCLLVAMGVVLFVEAVHHLVDPGQPVGTIWRPHGVRPGNPHLVLFGGELSRFGPLFDTWTWDGTNWTEQHPAHSAPNGIDTMAFDPAAHSVLAGQLGGGALVAWRCQELLMVAAAFWTASCAVVAGRPMSFTRSSLAVKNSPRARPASASARAAASSAGSPAAVRALV